MKTQKPKVNIMKKEWIYFIIVGVFLLTCLPGCVSSTRNANGDATDHIMAENDQMKKRLVLVERENDVLEKENLQYKAREQQLEAAIEKLKADLATLNEKYTTDMARNEEQIKNLENKYDLFEIQSTQTIADLNTEYELLNDERNQEVKTLNAKISAQQINFKKEKDQLKKARSAAELGFSNDINKLKNEIQKRDETISALQSANSLASTKTAELLKQLELAENDLQRTKSDNAKMSEQLKNQLKDGNPQTETTPPQ